MKQFKTVLKFELNNYFKNKSFMITTILLAVLAVGIIVVPTFIPGLLKKDSVSNQEVQEAEEGEKQDTLGIYLNTTEIEDSKPLLAMMPVQWQVFESGDSLKKSVEEGEIEAGFILDSLSSVTYVVNNLSMSDTYADMFETALTQYQKQLYLVEKGLTPNEAAEAESFFVELEPEILGKNSVSNFGYTYVLVFIIYILIIFYGQMIAVSVTTEKSNRAIEILVTSVNPNSLIFGKVLAGAIAGVLQMVLIVGSGFAAYHAVQSAWGGRLDFLFQIPAKVLAACAVFGLLSYLLYAFIFGTLGAMVSKTEDISKSSMPVTLIYVASFLIAMFGMTDSDSLLMKAASFVPFTSGNAMFIRISMGSVAVWEIVLSGAILTACCIAAGVLAAKLFRFGTLHYGNPIKITRALKNLRQE